MLSLRTDRLPTCEGITRRELLQAGMLALGGLTLPDLLSLRAHAASAGKPVKDTSVVLVFLTGGPSQIETFDPSMTAPAEYRSITGEVATRLPGVTFGGTFARLANWAHRMAVVRSFSHTTADHTRAVEQVIRGGNPAEASMGTVVAWLRGRGTSPSESDATLARSKTRGKLHPGIESDATLARSKTRGKLHPTLPPAHVHLNATEIDPQFHKEKQRLLTADGPGRLGALYAPFVPGGNGQVNRNLKLSVSPDCLADRRALHRAFDQFARQLDASGTMAALDRFEEQAFDLLLGKGRAAFDLSREDRRVRDRYDTSRFQTGIKKYRASALGHQMLLARRLCEAGCGFVTIHNPGWDMHGGNTQLNMTRGMEELGRPIDHALSAFLEDVEQRGLSRKILLVLTGEFGRTPRLNKNGGRDHWPQLSTLALAGGGLKMGQVVGRSSSRAEAPASRPITPAHLLATVLHLLFDLPTLRLLPGLPRSLATTINQAAPIPELI
jgi:uncharacterized protein (DUF1501 family)